MVLRQTMEPLLDWLDHRSPGKGNLDRPALQAAAPA
jgi:hypothetical protein